MTLNIQPSQVKPVGKFVFAKPIAVEEKTAAGIYLGSSANERPFTSEVLAVGEDSPELNGIKPGDKIVHKRWTGTELKLGADLYYFLAYNEILATFE